MMETFHERERKGRSHHFLEKEVEEREEEKAVLLLIARAFSIHHRLGLRKQGPSHTYPLAGPGDKPGYPTEHFSHFGSFKIRATVPTLLFLQFSAEFSKLVPKCKEELMMPNCFSKLNFLFLLLFWYPKLNGSVGRAEELGEQTLHFGTNFENSAEN